jgi:glycine dehydrogenase
MKNDLLAYRHIGISEKDEEKMLQKIGVKSLDELIDKTIPANIRLKEPLALPKTMTEYEFGQHIAGLAAKNKLYTTYIGMGWYNTITPAVIQRNVFENPVWYTSYTPYQTEVSQGRLEALMNFQTAVCDLTGMPLANCSLLDEATAAAEAVTMMLPRPCGIMQRRPTSRERKKGASTLRPMTLCQASSGYSRLWHPRWHRRC